MQHTNTNSQEQYDRARIRWTLEGGATAERRVYSTIKHLGSKLPYGEVVNLLHKLQREGWVTVIDQGQIFYGLTQKWIDAEKARKEKNAIR